MNFATTAYSKQIAWLIRDLKNKGFTLKEMCKFTQLTEGRVYEYLRMTDEKKEG